MNVGNLPSRLGGSDDNTHPEMGGEPMDHLIFLVLALVRSGDASVRIGSHQKVFHGHFVSERRCTVEA